MDMHRRPAIGLGTLGIHLGIFIGQHDPRIADRHLGMTDAPIGHGQTQRFLGTERLLVELDRLRRPIDHQIRRDAVMLIGNGFGFASHENLL
jgi:hypothetical protein